MRAHLILTLSLAAFLLCGCSRGPKNHFSIELAVDGQTVLKESAEGKRADRLSDSDREVTSTLEAASAFAHFVQSQISVRTTPIKVGANISETSRPQAGGRCETREISEISKTSLVITPPDGRVV